MEPTDNRRVEVTADNDNISNVSGSQIRKQPMLRIPTVTISEPVEKSRKISTVDAPDIDKLSPLIWSETSKNNSVRKGKVSSKTSQTKATQFNLYASQQWARLENKKQPQIQFSNKGKPKETRKLSMRSRKTVDTKVTLSVSQCRKARQISVPGENYFTSIPCFSDIDIECFHRTGKTSTELSGGSETSKTGTVQNPDDFEAFKKQGRTFMSLPLEQTDNSSAQQWNFNHNENSEKSGKSERHDVKDVYSDGRISSTKEKCLVAGVDGSKTKHFAHSNSGMNIKVSE